MCSLCVCGSVGSVGSVRSIKRSEFTYTFAYLLIRISTHTHSHAQTDRHTTHAGDANAACFSVCVSRASSWKIFWCLIALGDVKCDRWRATGRHLNTRVCVCTLCQQQQEPCATHTRHRLRWGNRRPRNGLATRGQTVHSFSMDMWDKAKSVGRTVAYNGVKFSDSVMIECCAECTIIDMMA